MRVRLHRPDGSVKFIARVGLAMGKNRWESAAHIAMGFFAGLLNLRLLLSLREWRQLPPENDAHPVVRIWFDKDGIPHTTADYPFAPHLPPRLKEYWSKARVLDTLSDSWEYRVGETAAWFVPAGIIIWMAM